MHEALKKRWVKTAGIILGCIALVYAMIYADIILRARSAYLQGEKYRYWHENPAAKAEALSAELVDEKLKLDKKLARRKLTQDDYNRELEIARFNNEQKRAESSIKYAYICRAFLAARIQVGAPCAGKNAQSQGTVEAGTESKEDTLRRLHAGIMQRLCR